MSFSWEQQNTDVHTPLPELNVHDLEQMSDEAFWNYARQRARLVSGPSSHADYLECRLSTYVCLVPLSNLAEVLPPPSRLTQLPGMPTWMAGIMAWRGETIAVVHLDLYFSPRPTPPEVADNMLLVVCSPDQVLGLLVPTLGPTTKVALDEIAPLDLDNEALPQQAEFFSGMYINVPLLDVSALLASLVQQIGMATSHG